MSLFGDQLPRLLRTKWKTPVALAQELYAMMGSANDQVTSDTPTTVTPANPNSAPNTIYEGWSPLQPFMGVKRSDGSTIAMTPSGFTDNGALIPGLTFPSPAASGVTGQPIPVAKPKPAGGGDAGTVLSGTGASYQVTLKNGSVVPATQGQIDPKETIPPGTFVLLSQVNGTYYMQVPVWLDDLP